MKSLHLFFLVPAFSLCLASCLEKNDYASSESLQGIVINEVFAHVDEDADTWVELINTQDKSISIKGIKLLMTDDYYYQYPIYEAGDISISPGEHFVISHSGGDLAMNITDSDELEVMMVSGDGTEIDSFSFNALDRLISHTKDGSYSRLPDGSDKWFVSHEGTEGEENFGYTSRNAFWLWSSYMDSVSLDVISQRGYGHILLNEYAYTGHTEAEVKDFIARAKDLGVTVHIWFQCFYSDGEWLSPIDDENACINQALYDQIITRAENYVKDGIEAIHLDYVRYGGTAYKHYVSESVNGEQSITEFCRQITTRLKAINPHVILSAAMMPEKDSEYYYGQNPNDMGKYLDILMPMVYRYNENSTYSMNWAVDMANWFVENSGSAEVWAGLTTYQYAGDEPVGMSQELILENIEGYRKSDASGIVLFRYGLGDFPDVNSIWK